MSAGAITMSNSIPSTSRKQGFLRRLIALILFVVGIALLMYLIDRTQNTISQTLMIIFADIAIALAAGFAARIAFYERNWLIQLISALAALVIGLFAIGYVTNWKLGIGPPEFWRNSFDWVEIAQLGGGMLVTIFGLRAWRRPVSRLVESPARGYQPEVHAEPTYEQPARSPGIDSPRFRTFFRRKSHAKKPVRLKVARQARAIERAAPQAEITISRRLKKSNRSGKRGSLFHRKPKLQISVYEEHRCPYCLEEVKRNDPRGVKECSVCHTLHHADCWDVTGMCQVPHLNS